MERLSAVYWEHIAPFLSNADVPHLLRACPVAWRETRHAPLPVHWNGKQAPPPRACGALRALTFAGTPQHAWGGGWGTFKVRITRLCIKPGAYPRLRALCLTNTQVRDLRPLRHCPLLEDVRCDFTPLASLRGLEGCARLRVLHCAFTNVGSLLPLAALRRLEELSAHHTRTPSLLPLRACAGALRALRAGHTRITGLGGLQGCARLRTLDAPTWNPQIASLAPLRACTQLERLNLNIESRMVQRYSTIHAPLAPPLDRHALGALRHLRDLRVAGYAPGPSSAGPPPPPLPPGLRRLQCSPALWESLAAQHTRSHGGRLEEGPLAGGTFSVVWVAE